MNGWDVKKQEIQSPSAPLPSLGGQIRPIQQASYIHLPTRHPCLLFLSGVQEGSMVVLDFYRRRCVQIGRDKSCDLCLDDPEISRQHAEIIALADGTIRVSDKQSMNGCYVNGRRIEQTMLQDGDVLRLGPYVLKLMFQDEVMLNYYTRLYEQSVKDTLTSTYNRRYFKQALDREWSYASRHKQNLSLAMMDLDHFKILNDTYGHAAGDVVLQEFTQRVLRSIRQEDILARHGGEEFVVLFRHTEADGLRTVARRILKAVGSTPFVVDDQAIKVTVSIGLLTYNPQHLQTKTPMEMMCEADARLYQAKADGRNRLCLHAVERRQGPRITRPMPRIKNQAQRPSLGGELSQHLGPSFQSQGCEGITLNEGTIGIKATYAPSRRALESFPSSVQNAPRKVGFQDSLEGRSHPHPKATASPHPRFSPSPSQSQPSQRDREQAMAKQKAMSGGSPVPSISPVGPASPMRPKGTRPIPDQTDDASVHTTGQSVNHAKSHGTAVSQQAAFHRQPTEAQLPVDP